MTYALIYAIGLVLTFVVISIWAFNKTKDDILEDVEFGPILGYSVVWPFTWIFVLIGSIFGR